MKNKKYGVFVYEKVDDTNISFEHFETLCEAEKKFKHHVKFISDECYAELWEADEEELFGNYGEPLKTTLK